MFCADEAVREGSSLVFRRFDELGFARQVLIRLRGDGVLLRRVRGPPPRCGNATLIRAVINEIAITVDADERVAELRILWQGDATTEVSMATLSTSDSSDSEPGPGGGDPSGSSSVPYYRWSARRWLSRWTVVITSCEQLS